jgi:hypothetical protein
VCSQTKKGSRQHYPMPSPHPSEENKNVES